MVFGTPGEAAIQYVFEPLPGVHQAAVNIQTGSLERKPRTGFCQFQFGPEHVQQIFGVATVEDGELGRQADELTVTPEQSGGDGVKCASPDGATGCGTTRAFAAIVRVHLLQDAIDAAQQFGRSAAGERQQQYPFGIDAGGNEIGHPMRERCRLAGSRTGDNQQRRVAVRGRGALLLVEIGENGIDA